MKIIKKDQPQEEAQTTFAEVFDAIVTNLQEKGASVSPDRQHAVESQLRKCLRFMGYRPRETAAKPATIEELALQCQQVIKTLNGVVPEKAHENLALHCQAVLSNVEAELMPDLNTKLKELPEAPAPQAPAK
jgi:uncharacterized protein (DUF362 family)